VGVGAVTFQEIEVGARTRGELGRSLGGRADRFARGQLCRPEGDARQNRYDGHGAGGTHGPRMAADRRRKAPKDEAHQRNPPRAQPQRYFGSRWAPRHVHRRYRGVVKAYPERWVPCKPDGSSETARSSNRFEAPTPTLKASTPWPKACTHHSTRLRRDQRRRGACLWLGKAPAMRTRCGWAPYRRSVCHLPGFREDG
jgi:hypothetical protein